MIKKTRLIFLMIFMSFINACVEDEMIISFHQAVSVSTPSDLTYESGDKTLFFKREPFLNNTHIKKISKEKDERTKRPLISIELTSLGADIMEQFSSHNINQWMAIMVNEEIVNAAIIKETLGAKMQIVLPEKVD
jgi:preprotein translocase subunit SecD